MKENDGRRREKKNPSADFIEQICALYNDNNISFSVAWFGEGLYFSAMVAQASPRVAVGHRKVYDWTMTPDEYDRVMSINLEGSACHRE